MRLLKLEPGPSPCLSDPAPEALEQMFSMPPVTETYRVGRCAGCRYAADALLLRVTPLCYGSVPSLGHHRFLPFRAFYASLGWRWRRCSARTLEQIE
jgi:hypothetical protein